MSQTGADSMAKEGKNYEEIIKHFYTGVEIKDFTWKLYNVCKNGNNDNTK